MSWFVLFGWLSVVYVVFSACTHSSHCLCLVIHLHTNLPAKYNLYDIAVGLLHDLPEEEKRRKIVNTNLGVYFAFGLTVL